MAQNLSNLPIGAKIKFGKHSVNGETAQPIIWLVVNKSGNISLLTEKAIDFRSFDALEPDATSGNMYGFSKYSVSNIRQWLNSNATAGNWFSAQHPNDVAPKHYRDSRNELVDTTWFNTPYENRPGFLYHFTTAEQNAIVNTQISESFRNRLGVVENTTLTNQKLFLPSREEVQTWEYFTKGSTVTCYPTAQAVNNSTVSLPQSINSTVNWWTRTQWGSSQTEVYFIFNNSIGDIGGEVYRGNYGLRPAMNLPTTLKISDTTDSDGCYTAVWNTAPSAPSVLNVPSTIYGSKSNAISWSAVSDPDGDSVTYTLECSVGGGAYTQLYRGTSTVYAHLVPFGTTSLQYRVKATDPSNASSAYTTSTNRTVVNNNAPVIDGTDSNLGVKSAGFTGTYKVTDANNNTVTVTESIDGVQIRSLVVTLGVTNTYGITGNTWLALPNGSHTLTIRATDGIDSSVRTYTFTKLVNSFTIRNATPWASATMPGRIMLVVTRNLPSGATFEVEVCNNGFDTNPTWEDATDAVKSGLVHVFANKVKTAGQWGVLIRVTVARNGATGACYVSAIGGNFE